MGGGAMTVSKYLATTLSNMGHDVHLLCLSLNDDAVCCSGLNYSVHLVSYPNTTNNPIISFAKKIRYIRNIYHSLVLIKPEIIHSQGIAPTYFTYVYSLKHCIPYCIGFHSDPFLYADSILSKIMLRCGKYLPFAKNASASFSVSEVIIPTIKQIFNLKPVYIANGADTRLFYPPIDRKRSFNIICVSRMVHDKGLEDAISAMAEIVDKYPEAILYLVGDGPLHQELENQVSVLSLQKNVIFTGFIKNNELIDYYHNSDVYLLPSWNEAFPMVLFEAMASGLPIVSTYVGMVPEIVTEENGILVPVKSPHDIAEAICKIFSLSSEEYQQMSERNVRIAKKNSWNVIAKEYESVYNTCLYS